MLLCAFRDISLRGWRGMLARSGRDFIASAAFSHDAVQISWLALSEGEAQISWQAQLLRKVRYIFCVGCLAGCVAGKVRH